MSVAIVYVIERHAQYWCTAPTAGFCQQYAAKSGLYSPQRTRHACTRSARNRLRGATCQQPGAGRITHGCSYEVETPEFEV